MKGQTLLQRFWSKVRVTDSCWLWVGEVYPANYGRILVDGQRVLAHRLSYALFRAEPGELLVCHHCDNPRCVRPDHLFVGTSKDNTQDMFSKGRARPNRGEEHWLRRHPELVRRGEEHHAARLNVAQVREIHDAYRVGGCSYADLARLYGITKSMVFQICTERAWRHLWEPVK